MAGIVQDFIWVKFVKERTQCIFRCGVAGRARQLSNYSLTKYKLLMDMLLHKLILDNSTGSNIVQLPSQMDVADEYTSCLHQDLDVVIL